MMLKDSQLLFRFGAFSVNIYIIDIFLFLVKYILLIIILEKCYEAQKITGEINLTP